MKLHLYRLSIKPREYLSDWDSDTIMTAAAYIGFTKGEGNPFQERPLFVISNGVPVGEQKEIVFKKGINLYPVVYRTAESVKFLVLTANLKKTLEYLEALSILGVGAKRSVGYGRFTIEGFELLEIPKGANGIILGNYAPMPGERMPLDPWDVGVKRPKTANGIFKKPFYYVKPGAVIPNIKEKLFFGGLLPVGENGIFQVCYALVYPTDGKGDWRTCVSG